MPDRPRRKWPPTSIGFKIWPALMDTRTEAPPPRPQDIRTHGGPSDRPPGAVAPGWWLLEQRVLDMLAAHTAETDPWRAAEAVFADQPRPARGRQRPYAGRSPLGILTDAWCNRRRRTEEPR